MADSMKAVVLNEYGAPENLKLETVPRPEPKDDEVLVKVHFAGVNPMDWKLRSGAYKAYYPLTFPNILGMDVSGTVEAFGSQVKGFQKGQAVFGIAQSAYAEYAVAKADHLTAKPEGLDFEVAASLPVGALTAWQEVEDAGISKGQTVLVQGAAGGVGLFAVQFAKLKGAKVIGVASGANEGFVKSLGADQFVDYKKGSVASQVKDIDVVLDTVGGETLEQSYSLVKKGGVLVTVAGQVSEDKAKEHGIKALGSGRGAPSLLKQIGELVAAKKVKAQVQKVYPLDDAKSAHALSQSGHGQGRIILKAK